jgi:phosphopentomutase
MRRAFIIVLDSVGIGGAPDADQYGDLGADTVGHIAEACWCSRQGGDGRAPLLLPNLVRLGLGKACQLATGRTPAGLDAAPAADASFGCAAEVSKGKDTPSGHWEIAGVPVDFEWGYFARTDPCFPPQLIDALCERGELSGVLGNRHASGTRIIAELGAEHIRSGQPICYTSADSVFQIAAHECSFGLQRLYEVCDIARELVDPLRIGRVIARPFLGSTPQTFYRTANRRDYSRPPPAPTILDLATQASRHVISVGKVGDIFAHSGTGSLLKADGNDQLFERTLEGARQLADGGLLFANFIDFDSKFGHRRDVWGYASALESLDARLPELLAELKSNDLLIITADHGCDPTWPGSDHTRELVPIIAVLASQPPLEIGRRATFADIGASVACHLQIEAPRAGRQFR